MPTLKKPSKSMAYQKHKAITDLDFVQKSLSNGAVLEKTDFYNKTEYGIKFTEGGYSRVTKKIYELCSNT